MAELSVATREALTKVGTSTLSGLLSRRGLKNMFMQQVWPIRPRSGANGRAGLHDALHPGP